MIACLVAMAMAQGTDLAWMAGSWHGDVWGGHMEEHWTAPSGSTLVGMNRVVTDGKTTHREYLAIDTIDGKTVMTVFVARKMDAPIEPVGFSLTESKEDHAVFTNPQHERLSKITYDRDDKKMHILLEGRRKDQPFKDSIELSRE